MQKFKYLYILGLFGGIASGKTACCQALNLYLNNTLKNSDIVNNIVLLNADKIAHECYTPGTDCYNSIINTFGDSILDNTNSDGMNLINRSKLGKIVFNDQSELNKLNHIIRPVLHNTIIHKLQSYEEKNSGIKFSMHKPSLSIIILEAALLYELELQHVCDELWCTIVNVNDAVSRIMQRDICNKQLALNKINKQVSNEENINKLNKHIKPSDSVYYQYIEIYDTSDKTLDDIKLNMSEKGDALIKRLIKSSKNKYME